MARRVKLKGPATLRIVDGAPRRSDDYRDQRLPLTLRIRAAAFTSQARSDRATAERRLVPVMAYVGPNGGGKTLCAVQDTLPALVAGKPVLSNTPLIDPRTGTPFPNWVDLQHADQLLDFAGGEVLLDEMVTVANSRESMRLDPRFQAAFQQLRKRVDAVRFTAPDFARADVIFREVTQAVTECRGFYPDRRGSLDQFGLPWPWAPRRLFRRATYETLEFTQWTSGKRDAAKPETLEWSMPARLELDPRQAYDTLAPVSKIAGIVVDGNCPHCGKRARVESCKGHTEAEIADMTAELDREVSQALERATGRHAAVEQA